MKLPLLPRWASLSIIGGVVLLLVIVGFQHCGGKKPAPTFQRIESAIMDTQNRIADLAKGLANLNSRVEILEKKSIPRVTSGTSNKKIMTPQVSKPQSSTLSTAVAPTTTPPFAAAVDLTPVVDGLGEIALAIKEAHSQPPTSTSPLVGESSLMVPLISDPCAGWMQNPVRYRRCRLWNQLP